MTLSVINIRASLHFSNIDYKILNFMAVTKVLLVYHSRHFNTYLAPPDIFGHDVSVQNSETTPYITLILLKKSTTAKKARY